MFSCLKTQHTACAGRRLWDRHKGLQTLTYSFTSTKTNTHIHAHTHTHTIMFPWYVQDIRSQLLTPPPLTTQAHKASTDSRFQNSVSHTDNNHGDNGEHYARVPLLHWPDRPMSLPVSQKPLILKDCLFLDVNKPFCATHTF